MNQYQFNQIIRKMERHYGRIYAGGEEPYYMLMFSMESNALKIHRRYSSSNSRRLREAILLALHQIDGYLKGSEPDVSSFEDEDNLRLKAALLSAFDPFSNPEIKEVLAGLDLADKDELDAYFRAPALCLMRIKESVDLWEKKRGSDGYFSFFENTMGAKIPWDDKMDYTVMM